MVVSKKIDLAYFSPLIGRGEQILILCAEHEIEVNLLNAKPLGDDFDKDTQSPFGTLPWMFDQSEELVLNDSMAIVQYLVRNYPGPASPRSVKEEALAANMWAWVQDYYSFVLSPFHDIIMGHNEPFWRNLRLTDTRSDGGNEKAIANLTKLHEQRITYLENVLQGMGSPDFLAGDGYTYADIYLYTCVRATQKCEGFGILRDSCGGDPFAECPQILNICDRVEERPVVSTLTAGKFDNALL
jgi:glutathione S-transferase